MNKTAWVWIAVVSVVLMLDAAVALVPAIKHFSVESAADHRFEQQNLRYSYLTGGEECLD